MDVQDLVDELAPGEPLMPSHRGVFGKLIEDNARLSTLVELLEQPIQERRNPVDLLVGHLRHAVSLLGQAKELTLYQLAEQYGQLSLPTTEARLFQRQLERSTITLDMVDGDTPPWNAALQATRRSLQRLMETEENSIIPDVKQRLSDEQAEDLALRYEQAKQQLAARAQPPV